MIMSKIPEELRIATTKDLSTEEWDLEPMFRFFERNYKYARNVNLLRDMSAPESPELIICPSDTQPLSRPPSTTSPLFTDGILQAQRSSIVKAHIPLRIAL